MVLESLSNPWKAEHRPSMLLLWGVIYALVGGLLATWLFPGNISSMVMVALVSGAAVPLMYNTIKFEEQKDLQIDGEKKLLEEHAKAVMVFFMLFLGITIGMTLLYLALPSEQAVNLFSSQIDTYKQINPAAQVTGQATGSGSMFQRIFINNLKVLFFCIIFSFLYGAGAIFVLTWNASVIALAIGNVVRTKLAIAAGGAGVVSVSSYLKIVAIDGFTRFFIHGIFEIGAYIIAALAGGIISVAIIKKHFNSDKSEHIILDISDLLLASFVVLLIAAVIEVYVTPAFY
jgi:uncharacterized membrane protein SpoIIM required for sporulation